MADENLIPKGIVYIGNLPFGFYEENLEKFFKQFGDISRIKVKRSDKNAKPMGYAYLEFLNEKVATIVANTMNNYLMFNKILKCHVVKGGDPYKIFRKRGLTAELCNGTRKKRRNQYKLENVSKEKVLKRLNQSKFRLSKALGVKIGPPLLIQNSNDKLLGKLKKEIFSKDKTASHDMKTVTKQKQRKEFNKKRIEEKDISTKMETPKSQEKTPKRKNSDSVVSLVKETPIYMDIEDEDDEIQLKTPPNVIKRYKRNGKIGSLKKKIFGNNRANKTVKKNDHSPSNDANQSVEKFSKKSKKASMKMENEGIFLKLDASGKVVKNKLREKSNSSKTAKSKMGKKSLKKIEELNQNKCNASQPSDQDTECVSPKVPGKSGKLKRKAESLNYEQTIKSKKFKLGSKMIKKERIPKSKSQVKLVSFKRKAAEAS